MQLVVSDRTDVCCGSCLTVRPTLVETELSFYIDFCCFVTISIFKMFQAHYETSRRHRLWDHDLWPLQDILRLTSADQHSRTSITGHQDRLDSASSLRATPWMGMAKIAENRRKSRRPSPPQVPINYRGWVHAGLTQCGVGQGLPPCQKWTRSVG